ncbi:hypothetical protein SKUN_00333 [Spiroplasma kunkelii CR2-3x]|uniref:Uncharacterized protein n=1 Tax=Spiroplasma kunkelii CR2-3x TaxID=273035 RepID=A0A0K2JFA5_SPIKU|nr:hypothetical protein [Spiroplasma kunkelii]ALA97250.1 hypothetical protein SKUN_00333 [Spiroplasma kunkelii CR2-3x]
MIKVGIDPSGTGTTAIVVYEDNKVIRKIEIIYNNWLKQLKFIIDVFSEFRYKNSYEISIENCLPTNANGSKDRDDLLRLVGALEIKLNDLQLEINWASPRHTKSVVKNMENLSKYQKITAVYEKDNSLTYEYSKGWFYNNEKISNHLRDAIIIANYEN